MEIVVKKTLGNFMTNMADILEKMKNIKALVIGDIMLDTYIYGQADRISPEGPVPVLKIDRESQMIGGAGNICTILGGLNIHADIISVIGDDFEGHAVCALARQNSTNTDNLLIDESRPTITKTRYLARGQQMLRIDKEKTHPIDQDMMDSIIKLAETKIPASDTVILSDYAKGVLQPGLISAIMDIAQTHKVPVIVDPKADDYSIYKGADVITPNKKELAGATAMAVDTDADIEKASQYLIEKTGVKAVLATRSEQGMSVIQKNTAPVHIATQAREVYDVSGAGDTVIAILGTALASGASLAQAADLANKAASIVVGRIGISPISFDDLTNENTSSFMTPISSWENAKAQIDAWKGQGLKVGFTNGCFDIIHYGHVNYLNMAREKCDRLVLGLNHDKSVKILKGPTRPVNDEVARANVMGALGSIDMVVFFGAEEDGQDNTPCALIEHLQPDMFFKGGDYTIDQLPETKIVQSYGGHVDIMNLYEGYSTTNIINKTKGEAA